MSKKDAKVPFVDLSAEELEKVATALQEKETDLETREAAFNEKAAELDARETTLNGKAAELDTKEAELNDKKAKLNKLEKDLKKKAGSTTQEPEPGLEFEFEGESYQFTDAAPKLIRIEGKAYTQQEIAESNDLALSLIGGNSGLIVKN